MYSRRFASRPDAPSPADSTLTLTQDDALSVLEYWQASAERLMLVYRRADERVTRIAHGRVRRATARELRVETDRGCLRVTLHSAAFEFRTRRHGAASHAHTSRSDGLLIRPKLDHWIFLRSTELHPADP